MERPVARRITNAHKTQLKLLSLAFLAATENAFPPYVCVYVCICVSSKGGVTVADMQPLKATDVQHAMNVH